MDGTPEDDVNTARDATLLDTGTRMAIFATLRPTLDALAAEVGTDAHISPDVHRVLRTVTRTHPTDTLALADLAARANTPKTPIPSALHELETCGYLARLTHIAPHLRAALPPHTWSTPHIPSSPVKPPEQPQLQRHSRGSGRYLGHV